MNGRSHTHRQGGGLSIDELLIFDLILHSYFVCSGPPQESLPWFFFKGSGRPGNMISTSSPRTAAAQKFLPGWKNEKRSESSVASGAKTAAYRRQRYIKSRRVSAQNNVLSTLTSKRWRRWRRRHCRSRRRRRECFVRYPARQRARRKSLEVVQKKFSNRNCVF